MRAWLALFAVLLLGTSLAGGIALAQPRPAKEQSRLPDPQVDRRTEIKKKIRVLRAATLTDELKLDEKALARLLPTLAKWDDVTDKGPQLLVGG